MHLATWAVPQLSRILLLDEESLNEIITYTETLPKDAAADHLKNLLGDSPQALEFIASFNARRQAPASEAREASSRNVSESEVPRVKPRTKKARQQLRKLPPGRQPENYGNIAGGYVKQEETDYVAGSARPRKEQLLANTLALKPEHDAVKSSVAMTSSNLSSDLPPSAAGSLISDEKPARSSSPASKAKSRISVAGGTSMHGQSTTLNDLDSAIRDLEIQTNPSLSNVGDDAMRRCNCMATRHELLSAVPNCLNCGKIICAKEGLGPCTFCGKPLISQSELQAMVRILRDERGKEKMEANNASYKRAEISKAHRLFANISTPASSAPSSDSETEKLAAAKQHRDKLLNFQAENARRTRVHDEAADFETPDTGQSMWATPQERALQLKRQQKVLREQQWNARPEYEKRRQVVSIDIVGGKMVRKMARVEQPKDPESEEDVSNVAESDAPDTGGAFAQNPLLGGLIKPVYHIKDKGKESKEERQTKWRRVQDDNDDNEQWILDGGTHGIQRV